MRSNVCNCRRLHMLDKSCPLHADRWRQIVVSSGCRSSTDHSEATVHRHIELVVHFGNRDLLNKTDEIPVYSPILKLKFFPECITLQDQINHQSRGRRLSRGALCRDRTWGHDMMEVMGSELQLGEEGGRRGQAMHCLHLPVEMT